MKNLKSFIDHKEKKGLPKERALRLNKHTVQAILHNNPHSAGENQSTLLELRVERWSRVSATDILGVLMSS